MIFSIFRFFCTLRFQIYKYCPIITNHTSMESYLFSFQMMHKSQFHKIDPYDWFCAAGTHYYKYGRSLYECLHQPWRSAHILTGSNCDLSFIVSSSVCSAPMSLSEDVKTLLMRTNTPELFVFTAFNTVLVCLYSRDAAYTTTLIGSFHRAVRVSTVRYKTMNCMSCLITTETPW